MKFIITKTKNSQNRYIQVKLVNCFLNMIVVVFEIQILKIKTDHP